ncbi:hypothetical protein B0I33_106278 [Prauserella shujinwangii]|uniref:Polyketide cyclase/dehydrase/lipid transport protein n=1 Tax=Prauserella shujinwangii TaxID=1453103 RepID=A0A2T0LTV9_9PSEU|nr:hypothetical protein [Prauserella shujinwangii]PRX47177.1 hypothetical protein B0I33_106278 [Prauserella shujinwangii]
MVHNLHVRRLPAGEAEVGRLLDSLAGPDDVLWPVAHWPRMRLDRALGTGAVGGHGPVRYHVGAYVPGRCVRFRFTAPRGFDGFHEFSTVPLGPDETELRHLLRIRLRTPAWLTWPLLWRPLHDALIEDSLDRAERAVRGDVRAPARWSPYVRLLRAFIGPRGSARPR